jgi:hypothetical protein
LYIITHQKHTLSLRSRSLDRVLLSSESEYSTSHSSLVHYNFVPHNYMFLLLMHTTLLAHTPVEKYFIPSVINLVMFSLCNFADLLSLHIITLTYYTKILSLIMIHYYYYTYTHMMYLGSLHLSLHSLYTSNLVLVLVLHEYGTDIYLVLKHTILFVMVHTTNLYTSYMTPPNDYFHHTSSSIPFRDLIHLASSSHPKIPY